MIDNLNRTLETTDDFDDDAMGLEGATLDVRRSSTLSSKLSQIVPAKGKMLKVHCFLLLLNPFVNIINISYVNSNCFVVAFVQWYFDNLNKYGCLIPWEACFSDYGGHRILSLACQMLKKSGAWHIIFFQNCALILIEWNSPQRLGTVIYEINRSNEI